MRFSSKRHTESFFLTHSPTKVNLDSTCVRAHKEHPHRINFQRSGLITITMTKEQQWLVHFQNVMHVLNVSCRDDSSVANPLLDMLSFRTGWPASRVQIDTPQYPFTSVRVLSCLKGGKGGFGTLLKGQSKQAGAKRTTDLGACRDMQGRRLRHVNDEIKLRKWRELQRRKQEGITGGEEEMWKTPSGLVRDLSIVVWDLVHVFTNSQ